MGDPIEIRSIAAVYGKDRNPDYRLCIGALKSNIGHLESAAGIAGVIKTILMLQHGKITPNLHLKTLNPLIDLKSCHGFIPTQSIPWECNNKPKRASVSSFGFSGTNAHIILEEAPLCQVSLVPSPELPCHLILLSAKTQKALQDKIQQLQEYLKKNPDANLGDISYILSPVVEHTLIGELPSLLTT